MNKYIMIFDVVKRPIGFIIFIGFIILISAF